jgi:hypothetical protein
MNTAVSPLSFESNTPSPARAGGAIRTWGARVGKSIWRVLEVSGQARAQRHLLDFANECERLQPNLAKELRAASRLGPMS